VYFFVIYYFSNTKKHNKSTPLEWVDPSAKNCVSWSSKLHIDYVCMQTIQNQTDWLQVTPIYPVQNFVWKVTTIQNIPTFHNNLALKRKKAESNVAFLYKETFTHQQISWVERSPWTSWPERQLSLTSPWTRWQTWETCGAESPETSCLRSWGSSGMCWLPWAWRESFCWGWTFWALQTKGGQKRKT